MLATLVLRGAGHPGALREVARCLGCCRAGWSRLPARLVFVAEVEPGLVVQDAVLLAFVLDNREMKLVVFLVAGPTLPCLARFLLPLQRSHRHRRHVTAPPELLSRAWRRLAWPGGSWPPSCGRPPAPEPVPRGWQRLKLRRFMSPCSETPAVALRAGLSAAVGHGGAAGCSSLLLCCFPGELLLVRGEAPRGARSRRCQHGAAALRSLLRSPLARAPLGARTCRAGTWRREPLISFQQQVGGPAEAGALGEQPEVFSCSFFRCRGTVCGSLPWSLFFLGSASVRLRSPTSVCWSAAKLLPRLVSFVSTKFRLQWTYQG